MKMRSLILVSTVLILQALSLHLAAIDPSIYRTQAQIEQ